VQNLKTLIVIPLERPAAAPTDALADELPHPRAAGHRPPEQPGARGAAGGLPAHP
jgi:hypothetical protein